MRRAAFRAADASAAIRVVDQSPSRGRTFRKIARKFTSKRRPGFLTTSKQPVLPAQCYRHHRPFAPVQIYFYPSVLQIHAHPVPLLHHIFTCLRQVPARSHLLSVFLDEPVQPRWSHSHRIPTPAHQSPSKIKSRHLPPSQRPPFRPGSSTRSKIKTLVLFTKLPK